MTLRIISQRRFDVLAGYARGPLLASICVEVQWFEETDSGVVAVLLLDTDREFSVVVLAPDETERYRWIAQTRFFDTPREAVDDLGRILSDVLPRLDEVRIQGDHPHDRAVDFFAVHPKTKSKNLHPSFVQLQGSNGWAPARRVVEHMMRWHEDADGNFIEQFQTTAFDARMWELYLFAALIEAGFTLENLAVPDFVARSPYGALAVEATTVNPTMVNGVPTEDPVAETDDEKRSYAEHYMPIRFAGPLTAKLAKRYWEQSHVAGLPLAIAIQDFHQPMSMMWTRSALPIYLYGRVHESHRDKDGSLVVTTRSIDVHRWGTKEVPSGFFDLPGAEHISAVMHNSQGTLSKFNRIGIGAGFGDSKVRMSRTGLAANPDPDADTALPFQHDVTEGYPETWMEGMDVYHNPRALHPLDDDLLPGATHHRLHTTGIVQSVVPAGQTLASASQIIAMRTNGGSAGAAREAR